MTTCTTVQIYRSFGRLYSLHLQCNVTVFLTVTTVSKYSCASLYELLSTSEPTANKHSTFGLLQVDQCGRLWVVDSGTVNIFTKERKRICQPQLLVFNLKNKKLLLRYRIPESVLEPHSILATVVADILDVTGRCREAFAYLADVTGFGLIVVDAHREKSWRVVGNYFYPYPLHGHFKINNAEFDLMDGVLGLALSPPQNDKKGKTLYFHSLASVRESWVSAELLRNESNFQNYINRVADKFYVSQGTRAGQSASSTMNGEGSALFFSVMTKNSLNCWNPKLPYNEQNIVEIDRDDVTFQFASGLKVRFSFSYSVLAHTVEIFVSPTVAVKVI